MGERQTGIRITLQGIDDVAVESAAEELKQRFGSRFAVLHRRRSKATTPELVITGTLLTSATASEDAGAADLIDLLYAEQARGAREGRAA